MEARMDPVVLVARSALLALVAVLLGTASRLGADGAAPSAGVLVLLGACVFVACLRLLRAPAGAARIVALLLGGQVATHLVLAATAGHGAGHGAASAAPGALALPVDHGRRLGSLQDSHDVATGHVDLAHVSATQLVSGVPSHSSVLLAHLLGAVALGVLLALGERCLWTLLGLLGAVVLRLRRALVAVPLRPAGASLRATRRTAPRVLLLLDRSVVRRGPPAPAVAR